MQNLEISRRYVNKLCNNSFILVGFRLIDKKDWNENKFKYIKDIVSDKGEMRTLEDIHKKYNLHTKQLEYNRLISSIPRERKIMRDLGCRVHDG